MSLRWLSSMVGGRVRVGIRRRAAPLARRELSAEIDADAIGVRRVWLREIVRDGQAQPTVVVRVDARARADVAAWLAGAATENGAAAALRGSPQEAASGADTPHEPNAPGEAESLHPRTELDDDALHSRAEMVADPHRHAAEVRTDWLCFPAGPEAILMGLVYWPAGPGTAGSADEDGEGIAPFRFNLRFAADPYRKHLRTIARSGLLGLTTEVLRLGAERELLSPCIFVPVQTGPLRTFLRELPSAPVV